MGNLRVHNVLKDRILVSRESARRLEDSLRELILSADTPENTSDRVSVIVDFDGVAPSFLDEIITIFESIIGGGNDGHGRCLVIANPPMRLSLKFEAIARGHGMSVRAQPDGSWLLTAAQDSGT